MKKLDPPGSPRMVYRMVCPLKIPDSLKLQSPVCCVMKMTHSSRDLGAGGLSFCLPRGGLLGHKSSAHFKQSSWDCSGFIEKSILKKHLLKAHLLLDGVPFSVGTSRRAGRSVDHSGVVHEFTRPSLSSSLSLTHFSFLVTSGTSPQ